ncbi:MAG: DivIVA domain-containing protein [Clostridia bacterium]|nr:DivIVA domain-containing protein [Clostridia bacterium]
MENDKKFASEMFGYAKREVEEYIKDMKADYEGRLQVEKAEVNRLSNEITIIRKKLERYDSEYLQKQEKVANALITAEDQSKAIVESARQEAINEKNRIEALIEAEKEKLLDIKKEVIELKERTIQVLEKYNNTMSDLLE